MTDLLRNTQPIFRLGGEPAGTLTADAQYVCVDETTEGLRSLQLVLIAQSNAESVDDGLLYLDGQTVDFGKEIEVELGGEGEARTVFKGRISAVEASFGEGEHARVSVLAEDALMRLRFARRCQTYESKTDAQIAEEIAGFHSLGAQATAEGPTYDYVQQWNQSDLAFLRYRARLVAAELWADGETLHFEARTTRRGPELTLVRGADLMDVQIRADTAPQRSRVVVSGYDDRQKAMVDEEGAADVISAEAGSGKKGIDLVKPVSGDDRDSLRVRDVPLNDAEATAFARAEMQRRARAFVVASGMTNGTTDLVVGSRLTLQRVGRPFNGAGYYVTHVKHTWERAGGFRTHFEAERPNLGGSA